MGNIAIKTKLGEQGGRYFDIRVLRYHGDLLEAAPFEGGKMADLPYPDGLLGQPLYQVSLPADAVLTSAVLDSLIATAEADIRRRVPLGPALSSIDGDPS